MIGFHTQGPVYTTRDFDLKFVGKGDDKTAVANFGVAVNEKRGEEERVHFFECRIWGKQAEACATRVGKGSPVYLEGVVKQESWKDKNDGSNRSKDVLEVKTLRFCGDLKAPEGGSDEPNF